MKRAMIAFGTMAMLVACTGGQQAQLTTTAPPAGTPVAQAGPSAAPQANPPAQQTPQQTPAKPQATGSDGGGQAAPLGTTAWTGTWTGPDGSFKLTQSGSQVSGTQTRPADGGGTETVDVLGNVGSNPDGSQYAALNYKDGKTKLITLMPSGTRITVDGKDYGKS